MCIKITILNSNSHEKLSNPVPSKNAELIEYQEAQDFALQADTIGWQISSILISAVLVTFGFVLSGKSTIKYIFGVILFINIVLSIWILIFLGQQQLKLMKLYRVREIEKKYGLKQNYYWELDRCGTKQGKYRTYGPSGVLLTKYLFCLLVFSSFLFGFFEMISPNNHYDFFSLNGLLLILSIIIPSLTLFNGCKRESELKAYIDGKP